MRIFSFLIISVFITRSVSFAQEKTEKVGSVKQANEKFLAGNYEGALQEYLLLHELEDENEKYNYRLGVCYLNTNIDKKKAIPHLEFVTGLPKYDPNALYLLGRAYHFANRFDEAIIAYNKFKKAGGGSPENLKDVDRQIEYCYNGKELIKFPLNVSFENLGKNVNSPYPDYFPFISTDESTLIFNSRRDEGAVLGVDDKYAADVFISNEKGGKWQKAKSIGDVINSKDGDEEIVGLSADGNTVIFHFDNNIGFGDLFIGKREGLGFSKPQPLSQDINSKAVEIAAAISPDGNTIYFASDRPGGFGGIDLYRVQRLPKGNWSEAFNLGPVVNTPRDEDFPTLSIDGKTLYFSSKGHTTMGGYDIFKASWDSVTSGWMGVKNIGYPINNSDDNLNLCMSEDGRYGYISALREGGLGDLDIYRVVFNDVEPKYTVIKGNISSNNAFKQISNVAITVTDNKSSDIFGSYLPNPASGNYVIILPPGRYNLQIDADGFKSFTEDLTIADKASFQTTIDKDIKLLSK